MDRSLPSAGRGDRDADLYIVDATDRYQQANIAPNVRKPALNLTSREAGQAAATAGAHRLMLTHFWPGNDRDRSVKDAAEAFSGEILVADEGATIDLH